MKTKCNSNYAGRHKKGFSYLAILLSLAVLNLTFSCNYYKVKEVKAENDQEVARQIKEFNEMGKYVIIHKINSSFELADVTVDEGNLSLKGQIKKLDPKHSYEKYPEIGKSYRYKEKESSPLNEIHLYITEDVQLTRGEQVSIPLDKISKIGVTDKNTGKTVMMATLGGLGALAIILIIIALTKSSCPFIYSYDGTEYVFAGELYPGNIIKNAQNIDFLKINDIREIDGEYRIKITNELLEIQHTDLAELLVVDHPKNTEILLDPSGTPVLFFDLIAPEYVEIDGIPGNIEPILKKDNEHHSFNSLYNREKGIRNLTFSFDKPAYQKEANLYLSIKNSYWLDYLYGKFNEKFGIYYNTFQKQQQNATRAETHEWIASQNLPIKVYIKENGSWKFINEIITAGPMAFRDIGLKIPIYETKSEKLEIKLETGFMFWDLDYVAVDFPSQNSAISIQELKPISAISNNSKNVTMALGSADDNYVTQASYGDAIEIKYKATPQKQDLARSVFVKNKGYYTYIRDYKGLPDFTELKKFREPGYFTEFSKNTYYEMILPYLMEDELAANTYEN